MIEKSLTDTSPSIRRRSIFWMGTAWIGFFAAAEIDTYFVINEKLGPYLLLSIIFWIPFEVLMIQAILGKKITKIMGTLVSQSLPVKVFAIASLISVTFVMWTLYHMILVIPTLPP